MKNTIIQESEHRHTMRSFSSEIEVCRCSNMQRVVVEWCTIKSQDCGNSHSYSFVEFFFSASAAFITFLCKLSQLFFGIWLIMSNIN